MRGKWIPCAAVIAALAVCQRGGATPPLTLVQDTLYKADGSRFEGIAQIEWKSFQASDGSIVPQRTLSLDIVKGYLRVELVPTTDALQPAYYTVRFNSAGRIAFVEYWMVPPSAYPLRLSQVRTSAPLASNLMSSEPIPIQDVAGLRTELDLRPARGANWITSRAAVIGATGGIEGVIGSPEDCVRVDGTSTPCGTTGASGGSASFTDGETPAGNMDGVNTVFVLNMAPEPAASLGFFRNGILLRQGVDYTLTGASITFAPGLAPVSGDILQAWYRYGAGSSASFGDLEVPSGTIDGVNTVFSLSAGPVPSSSLQLYRNGLLQKPGVDFSVAGATVTFMTESVQQIGDTIQATYRK